jgi:putative chitobiose transport system permease protein
MNQRRPWWLTGLIWTGAALLAVLAIGPAIWLTAIALQPPGGELYSLFGGLTTQNFQTAWNDGQMGRPLLNSILVTFARASLNVVIAALAAYPLARMNFKWRNAMFVGLLCTLMVPEQVIVVPMFRIVVGMNLYDTLTAVVLPFSVSAFGIFMCRQAFMAIPKSLEEAARIDGAHSLHIWWHIMLPLAAPTLATLGLFSVIGAWSDLLWPLIVLQSKENLTLPVAVNSLLGTFSTNVRAAYAGAVLALIPIIVIFILIQRFMKPEMFGGAVKG